MQYQDTQIFHLRDFKLSLLWFAEQVILAQSFQNLSGDFPMSGYVIGIDQDIIKIDRELSFNNKVFKDVVHIHRECAV